MAEHSESGPCDEELRRRATLLIFDHGWQFRGEFGGPDHARHIADLVLNDLDLCGLLPVISDLIERNDAPGSDWHLPHGTRGPLVRWWASHCRGPNTGGAT